MKLAAALLVAQAAFASADASFILETRSPRPYTPAYLGNGAIGLSTTVSGAAPAECFVAGMYDHAPGDVARIAVVPGWNEVDVYDGSAWRSRAAADGSEFREYRQALDMFDGVLRTEYDWASGNRTVRLRIESFVSRADPALGVVRLEVTPRSSGPLRVRLSLRPWPPPRRYALEQLQKLEGEAAKNRQAIWYPGHMVAERPHAEAHEGGGSLDLLSYPEGGAAALSEAVSLRWPRDLDSPRVSTSPQHDAVEIEFDGRAGRAEVFEKFAVLMP